MVELSSRHLGAGVVSASDESFGNKEHLLTAEPADFVPGTYDHRGEVVDGWETRRRREPGHDWAIVRLGLPGVIRRVDVDTSSSPATSRRSAGSRPAGSRATRGRPRLRRGRLGDHRRPAAAQGRRPQPGRGLQRPALHPRAARHLPRRRRGSPAHPWPADHRPASARWGDRRPRLPASSKPPGSCVQSDNFYELRAGPDRPGTGHGPWAKGGRHDDAVTTATTGP